MTCSLYGNEFAAVYSCHHDNIYFLIYDIYMSDIHGLYTRIWQKKVCFKHLLRFLASRIGFAASLEKISEN